LGSQLFGQFRYLAIHCVGTGSMEVDEHLLLLHTLLTLVFMQHGIGKRDV
jgi:hypothetical protein